MKPHGFTLIEFVIYIGLVTIIVGASVTFAWMLIDDQIKQSRLLEVEDSAQFVLQTIGREFKRAESVNAASVYAINPGILQLDSTEDRDVRFFVQPVTLNVGGTEIVINKLYRRWLDQGQDTADLTSDNVDVTDFVLTNLTSGTVQIVKVDLTLRSVDPGEADHVFGAQNSWSAAFTNRRTAD